MDNRLNHFLGKPINLNGVLIHPPTIEDITEMAQGEITYHVYVAISTFDKEAVLKQMLGMSDEDYDEISDTEPYEILTTIPQILDLAIAAINFFVKGIVTFDLPTQSFLVDGKFFINRNNYTEFIMILKEMNCVTKQDEMKFKNDRVKKKYKQMMMEKNKQNKGKNDSLELKDMLSILCSAEGNGINIFNCSQLKIYQVYEQFERINVRENHLRTLQLWANTYTLKEGTKLPEWIIKTKL